MIDNVPVDTRYITLLTRFWITIFNHLVSMADPESSDSLQAKFISECKREFQQRNMGFIANVLHKDFRTVPYPRSLGYPEQTKEEWLEHWAGIMSLWTTDIEVSCIGCSSSPPSYD